MDHFEVFGLPRRLAVDTAELQRKFYELSRRYHPDFHQTAPPEEQVRALEASAGLNAAYRALRDPISRIEYLVRLEEGRETKEGATVKPKAPPELLEEMFEIQEALQEAKSAGQSVGLDAGAKRTLSDQRDRPRALRAGRGPPARSPQPGMGRGGTGRPRRSADGLQGGARGPRIPQNGHRRHRRSARRVRGGSCLASSALISARPTAWSRTWTTRPACPGSSPIGTGRCSCRPSSRSRPRACWSAPRRSGGSFAGRSRRSIPSSG